jgi:electron transfer flavoprotein alpha subunit
MSVLVFAENSNGEFKKSAYEAVSYGAYIAQKMNTTVEVVSLGHVSDSVLAGLGNYGATKVHSASNGFASFDPGAFAAAIAEAAKAADAQVVVIANTYTGKAVAPRVAVRLQAGLAPGAVAVPTINGSFSVRRAVFSNKGFAEVAINTPVKVISLTPNSYSINQTGGTATLEAFTPAIKTTGIQVREVKKAAGKIALTEAEIVVSGGRGMKGPENWALVENLAETLGAATACSKPVSDMDWRPHSEHVGQTGITIKPNLYIAAGISGAIQHLAGVSGSKTIIVINSDKDAPFYKAADYGVIGDIFDVLPRLNEAFKKFKASI